MKNTTNICKDKQFDGIKYLNVRYGYDFNFDFLILCYIDYERYLFFSFDSFVWPFFDNGLVIAFGKGKYRSEVLLLMLLALQTIQ